jgi:phage gpG-like protein/phage gp36-like protein
MTPLLSVERFLSMQGGSVPIPLAEGGEPDAARIETALRQATGVIVAHLPWLLDGAGEIGRPVNPQFAEALEAVCADIALDRMTDTVSGSENARNKYKESLALLEKINREYQGGLEGPGLQESEVVISGKDGSPDGNPWKALVQKTRDYYAGKGLLGSRSILVGEGMLRDSLTSEVQGGAWSVLVGAAMEYAAVHQFGAEIKPKSAKALFAPGYGMLKKATIPPRPYLGVSAEDTKAIENAVAVFLEGVLK